jgi:hypothetical protein
MKLYLSISILLIFQTFLYANGFQYARIRPEKWVHSKKATLLEGKLTNAAIRGLNARLSRFSEPIVFLNDGDKLQAVSFCSFDLFEIEGDKIEQKYNFFNRGHTCLTIPFIRDSSTYMLGGAGLWTTHMDLLQFDVFNGGWEFVKVKNQPLDYHTEVAYQNEKGMYVLFGDNLNIRKDFAVGESHGYFLDWKTKEWKRLKFDIEGNTVEKFRSRLTMRSVETADYCFLYSKPIIENMGWNIIDKKTGKIYLYKAMDNDQIYESPFIEVMGNKVTYQLASNAITTLDIDEMFKKSVQVGQIVIDEKFGQESQFSIKDVLYGGIILTLLSSLFFIVRKNAKPKEEVPVDDSPVTNELDSLVDKLCAYAGQPLDTDRIDKILGIDNADNMDSKRLKRSRLITKVNEYYLQKNGKDLVTRERNPDDKRYMYYKIES